MYVCLLAMPMSVVRKQHFTSIPFEECCCHVGSSGQAWQQGSFPPKPSHWPWDASEYYNSFLFFIFPSKPLDVRDRQTSRQTYRQRQVERMTRTSSAVTSPKWAFGVVCIREGLLLRSLGDTGGRTQRIPS